SDWIKLKCGRRQEFVIGGYTDPKGSRTGIGSLLLGVQGEDGALRYAGNVGTGFNERVLRELRDKLNTLNSAASPFAADAEIPSRAHWVRPELVCEVSFGEWTRSGRVRHSVFQGLRADKRPLEITREVPRHDAPVDKLARPTERRGSAPSPRRAQGSASQRPHVAPNGAASEVALPPTLRVTHPDRVIDPASGSTKIDLVRYYAKVGALMMDHLRGRPVALVRAPSGIGGELFFQKHAERYKMPGVVQLDPALDPDHPPMLEVATPEGLLSAAQMNVVEFHTWNAVKRAIGKPDRMTFDLDPGEGVTWAQMQEAAQLLHSFLTDLELAAFLKTSGGKGLHVVVPLKPRADWDTVKDFSRAVVQHLAGTLPQRFVAKSGGTNRVGRIFIDYLRNGFGATTVAAWSARSRPGLGISVPVHWDELKVLKSGDHWTVAGIDERLDQGNTPWRDYEASRNPLEPAMRALGFPGR
ncbi:MAG TPA: DNA ligase D, partial [Ramlibacter sp.]|nr:DNA ligase D [Ramlibacter sp.]